MKIYREPKPVDDEWRDDWNPDKLKKSDPPDEPDETSEIISSPEPILFPMRQPREVDQPVKPSRESAKENLIKRLSDPPDDEDKPANTRLDNLIHAVTLDWLDGETDEDLVFKTRSKLVKRYMRHIAQNYSKELAYSRPYNFALGWMEDAASRTFERWPIIAEAMQFLYSRQRSLNAILMNSLENQNSIWIPGRKYKHDSGKLYPFATFMTDKEFYADLGKHINTRRGEQPSENYQHRIVTAFKEAKIIQELGGSKRTGFIVTDGFYRFTGDRWIKHLFLKDTPQFRKALHDWSM